MSVEAVPLEESPDFERAAGIATRFLENVETVVHGKSEEIKLVLAAMTCGGHVLLETRSRVSSGCRPRDR